MTDAVGTQSKQRPRRWVRYLTVLAVLLFATELVLRLGFGFGRPLLVQSDPEIGYLFQPDQKLNRFGRRVEINSYHQRNGPIAPAPAPGVLRVFCLGDSVTFGGTLTDQTETYPELLAARLLPAHPGGVEILNASAGSWGLGNEAAYLRRFGTFGSQYVVLQIGSHDLKQETSTGDVVGKHESYPDRNPPAALLELFTRYVRPRLFPPPAEGPPPPGSKPDDASFAENLETFTGMVRQIRESGASPIVLHTPDRFEVTGTTPADPDRERWRATFLERCRDLAVPVVNLRNDWNGRPDADSLFRDIVHLNPLGNRAVAERLAPEIR